MTHFRKTHIHICVCAVVYIMASGSKKKKKTVSKAEFKRIASQKGKKSVEKQGRGAGSRKSFTLPAKWSEKHTEEDGKTRVKFVCPGKTEYKTEKSVVETLVARSLEACFNICSASSEDTASEGSEFNPDMSDAEKPGCSKTSTPTSRKVEREAEGYTSQPVAKKMKKDVERRLFVTESSQLMDFVEQVNRMLCCSTPDCPGKISITILPSPLP